MSSLMTDAVAQTVIALDDAGPSSLTEIARATSRPLSSVQRSVHSLVDAGVLSREAPRGRFAFAPGVPRRALRAVAEWALADRHAGVHANGVARADFDLSGLHLQAKVREHLPRAVGAIVDAVHPARVLLIGSQARGDARPDSDVDFLVVIDAGVEPREARVSIRRALSSLPFAKDILVATADQLARPPAGTALAEGAREGIELYAR